MNFLFDCNALIKLMLKASYLGKYTYILKVAMFYRNNILFEMRWRYDNSPKSYRMSIAFRYRYRKRRIYCRSNGFMYVFIRGFMGTSYLRRMNLLECENFVSRFATSRWMLCEEKSLKCTHKSCLTVPSVGNNRDVM